jgi:hypothetical protein
MGWPCSCLLRTHVGELYACLSNSTWTRTKALLSCQQVSSCRSLCAQKLLHVQLWITDATVCEDLIIQHTQFPKGFLEPHTAPSTASSECRCLCADPNWDGFRRSRDKLRVAA